VQPVSRRQPRVEAVDAAAYDLRGDSGIPLDHRGLGREIDTGACYPRQPLQGRLDARRSEMAQQALRFDLNETGIHLTTNDERRHPNPGCGASLRIRCPHASITWIGS